MNVAIVIAIMGIIASFMIPFLNGWINKVGIDAAARKTRKIIVIAFFGFATAFNIFVAVYRLIPYLLDQNLPVKFIDFACFTAVLFSIFALISWYVTNRILDLIKRLTVIHVRSRGGDPGDILGPEFLEDIQNTETAKNNEPQ